MNEWVNILLEVNSTPVVELEVKVEHLVGELSIFKLASVNDHRLAKDSSLVIFSWQDIDTFCPYNIVPSLNSIE